MQLSTIYYILFHTCIAVEKFLFSCCFLIISLPYIVIVTFFSQMKPLVACTLSWRALSTLLPSNRKLMLRRLLHNRPKRLSEMFQKASDIPKEGETTSVSHKVCYLQFPFISLQISFTNVSLQIQINRLEEEIKWKSVHFYFIHGAGIMVLLLTLSSLISCKPT